MSETRDTQPDAPAAERVRELEAERDRLKAELAESQWAIAHAGENALAKLTESGIEFYEIDGDGEAYGEPRKLVYCTDPGDSSVGIGSSAWWQAVMPKAGERDHFAMCGQFAIRTLGLDDSSNSPAEVEEAITKLRSQNAALEQQLANLELLVKVTSDDGASFNEPMGDIPGTIEIRTESRDNSEWLSLPCEYRIDEAGWPIPVVTPEIRVALQAALLAWDGVERPGPIAELQQQLAAARGERERAMQVVAKYRSASQAGGRAWDENVLYDALQDTNRLIRALTTEQPQ